LISKKEILHLRGPLLPILLCYAGQFPEVMGIVKSVRIGILIIRFAEIMDGCSLKIRQNTYFLGGFLAAFGVSGVRGQLLCADYMKPFPLAVHVHPCLVTVDHRRSN